MWWIWAAVQNYWYKYFLITISLYSIWRVIIIIFSILKPGGKRILNIRCCLRFCHWWIYCRWEQALPWEKTNELKSFRLKSSSFHQNQEVKYNSTSKNSLAIFIKVKDYYFLIGKALYTKTLAKFWRGRFLALIIKSLSLVIWKFESSQKPVN